MVSPADMPGCDDASGNRDGMPERNGFQRPQRGIHRPGVPQLVLEKLDRGCPGGCVPLLGPWPLTLWLLGRWWGKGGDQIGVAQRRVGGGDFGEWCAGVSWSAGESKRQDTGHLLATAPYRRTGGHRRGGETGAMAAMIGRSEPRARSTYDALRGGIIRPP